MCVWFEIGGMKEGERGTSLSASRTTLTCWLVHESCFLRPRQLLAVWDLKRLPGERAVWHRCRCSYWVGGLLFIHLGRVPLRPAGAPDRAGVRHAAGRQSNIAAAFEKLMPPSGRCECPTSMGLRSVAHCFPNPLSQLPVHVPLLVLISTLWVRLQAPSRA